MHDTVLPPHSTPPLLHSANSEVHHMHASSVPCPSLRLTLLPYIPIPRGRTSDDDVRLGPIRDCARDVFDVCRWWVVVDVILAALAMTMLVWGQRMMRSRNSYGNGRECKPPHQWRSLPIGQDKLPSSPLSHHHHHHHHGFHW